MHDSEMVLAVERILLGCAELVKEKAFHAERVGNVHRLQERARLVRLGRATAITPATRRRAGVPATIPASSGSVRAPVSRIRPASSTPCSANPSDPDASHQIAGNPMSSAFAATPRVADAPSIVAISVRNTARLPRSCPAAM